MHQQILFYNSGLYIGLRVLIQLCGYITEAVLADAHKCKRKEGQYLFNKRVTVKNADL